MNTIYQCKCGAKNRISTLAAPLGKSVVNCGKCHQPLATIKSSGFVHSIRPYRPRKPRGICGCCGQKPYPGDKLYQGFCPDCWANMDGMGRPPRRF